MILLTLRKALDSALDYESVAGRLVRLEAVTRAAIDHAHQMEQQLLAVDNVLLAELVPEELTRVGQIRWLGDRRRVAELQLQAALDLHGELVAESRLARRLRDAYGRFTGLPMQADGQMDIDECIAEVERGA